MALKGNPEKWDAHGWVGSGYEIQEWWLKQSYRCELMQDGDPVFLWISGKDRDIPAGIWGEGVVLGPCYLEDGDVWAHVSIAEVDQPLLREHLKELPVFRTAEVIRMAAGSNPSYLNPDQADVLFGLLDDEQRDDLYEGEGGRHSTTPKDREAVEWAAMDFVSDHFEERGWNCEDVSRENLGWDITARRSQRTIRIEVKGVSGKDARVLLTPNELRASQQAGAWVLAAVTEAMTNPKLTLFGASAVGVAAMPSEYSVDLSNSKPARLRLR